MALTDRMELVKFHLELVDSNTEQEHALGQTVLHTRKHNLEFVALLFVVLGALGLVSDQELIEEPELVKIQTAAPTLKQKLGVPQDLVIAVAHVAGLGLLEEPVQLLSYLQTALALQAHTHKLVKKSSL